MAGLELRKPGTTATYAPVIKRGVATLSDGRVVALAIDTNLASSSGTDVTGVAKIHLYVSTNTSRTAFALAISTTPAVAPASATRNACASMSVASDNSIWVAWQGVDNALYVTKYTYTAGVVAFVSTTTVSAAGAITNRFRCIDIDITGTANVLVGTYEANDAAGSGAWHRAYVLNNSAAWLRVFNLTALAAGLFIKTGSEDVSIAWRGDGIVTNVGRMMFYGTKTQTTVDQGDLLREYSFNVSSGAADSGTNLGTWSSLLNKNQAAGTRRAMIFSLSATLYMFSGVIGNSVPKFFAAKLTTGVYGAPSFTTAGFVSTVALSNYFKIDSSYNIKTAWTATYKDNRLVFGFASIGPTGTPRISREVVFTYASLAAASAKPTVDSVPRPLDSAFYGDGGPIALYGGDNRRVAAGLKYYNFVVMYGRSGATVSVSWNRTLRFVAEDTFDKPYNVSPDTSVEPTNTPLYRVRVENLNLQPNLWGKLEIQIASNASFSLDVHSVIEDDSKYQYFGSKDGLTGNTKQVAVPTLTALSSLFTGTWFWRARLISDKDTPGAWSDYDTFTVSHPPTALPVQPAPNSVVKADTIGGVVDFVWQFSDTNPTDDQTAYRIILTRTDTGAAYHDTGFVSSASKFASIIPTAVLEIPLTWTIQLKDTDGASGPVSNPVGFTVGQAPTVTVNLPVAASVVTTAMPTVQWTYTGFGSRLQRAYRIYVQETLTDLIVADTLWQIGAVTSYTFPTNVVVTGGDYTIKVEVQDDGGLIGEGIVQFDTDWIEPALATPVITVDSFKVHIAWTNATEDAEFAAWRVYRRYMKPASIELDVDDTALNWVLLYETEDVLTNYSYDDYLAPLNRSCQYVITQLADRFGSLAESNITSFSTIVQASDRYFFVPMVPVGTIASFEASSVTGDQFTREIETETLHVIGRGRQVQVGDDLGYVGSLSIKLRSPSMARINREFFEAISADNNSVYIKSPFGDVFLIALGNIQTNRLPGFGSGDLVDLTVPYSQIIESTPVIRLG